MFDRRRFLQQSSLIALAPTVPAFLAQSCRATEARRDERVLVVLQLNGGNDGVNTVVPFADEGYAKNRDRLRLERDQLIKLSDTVGLHDAMRGAGKLWETGRLAIVQGVGYPNPNRSHDVSMAIWQTCRFDPKEHKTRGWLGRALDASTPSEKRAPSSLLVGNEGLPVALQGRKSVAAAIDRADEFIIENRLADLGSTANASGSDLLAYVRRSTLDAYATADRVSEAVRKVTVNARYPSTGLGQRLSLIGQLIKSDFGARVYYAAQSGYDTHSEQKFEHANLLRALSDAMHAFLEDLRAAKLDDRVLVLCFSEFGRRVEENGSLGTDHGTAGPVFLAGPSVNPGLHGQTPSLTDLEDGDLKMSVDFRRVYSEVLRNWLNLDPTMAVGGSFEPLGLIPA